MDNDDPGDIIKIYPGKYTKIDTNIDKNIEELYSHQKSVSKKVIVLDLDETIGSFTDLYRLWSSIDDYLKISINKSISDFIIFSSLSDLYPEFLRHGILHILEFIYHKKKQGICSNIYLYTNNQIIINSENSTPTRWVCKIVNYLTMKVCGTNTDELFDKLICAFKINRKIIEIKRTTNSKTHADFIKCTLLPKTTEICFLDNTYFSNMVNEKVYYIQPRSYYHCLSIKTIISRFIISPMSSEFSSNIENFITDWFAMNSTEYKPHPLDLDVFVAHKMMYHIKEFFYLTSRKNKTKKNRVNLSRATRKYIQAATL